MKKNILMIQTQNSTFVKRDYETLSNHFNVFSYTFIPYKNPFRLFLELIKEKLFILSKIGKIDIFYIWFADYHSLIPVILSKIFKKKSFLVLGGYDVINIPEIKYGSFNNPIRAFFAKKSMQFCTLNLPVCEFIAEDAKRIIKDLHYKIVYTGYDENKFLPGRKKEDIVLVVSIVDTEKRYFIKGIDILLKLASMKKNIKFLTIGINKNLIKAKIPENIIFLNTLSDSELIKLYQKSKVVALFSRREGLPNSLCEGMLCECIPFGNNNGGIPTAIGNSGYLFESNNLQDASEKLELALENNDLGKVARLRIIENFSLEKRELKLFQIIY